MPKSGCPSHQVLRQNLTWIMSYTEKGVFLEVSL